MNISTTVLQSYDICKQAYDAETCKSKAMQEAPQLVNYFLSAYDLCLQIPFVSVDTCRRTFSYDVQTPPAVPFFLGLAIGFLLFKPSKKLR
jgi:hypothetical protein